MKNLNSRNISDQILFDFIKNILLNLKKKKEEISFKLIDLKTEKKKIKYLF